MDVVCVIDTVVGDHLEDRLCALEEVKQAVQSAGANFQRVQVGFMIAVKDCYTINIIKVKIKFAYLYVHIVNIFLYAQYMIAVREIGFW